MTEQTQHSRSSDSRKLPQSGHEPQADLGYSLYQLGQGLMQHERWQEAREAIELSLSFRPAFPRGHFDLGNLLHSEGRNQDAARSYRRAVELEPDFAEAWYNLGVVLMIGQRFEESAEAYRHAVTLKPDYPEAHNNLGILLQSQGNAKAAVEHYRVAARLNPKFSSAYYNLALTLQQQGDLEQSLDVYQDLFSSAGGVSEAGAAKAVELERSAALMHVDAQNNRANVLLEIGDYRGARDAYRGVLALDPKHPEANWNLGLVQLQLGEWTEGWKQYEWRLKQPGKKPLHRSRPRWDGRPLKGRRILLDCEQGLGDALQFVRFAPLVAERGGRVWIECHAPLVHMFKRLSFVEGVTAKGQELPDFDFHVPVMSLPFVLGINEPGAVPCSPYLSADGTLADFYKARMMELARPWIGITWSGNPELKTNAKRSLTIEQVSELRDGMPGSWVSLQKGATHTPGNLIQVENGQSSTMDHAAALIANLDLVISVDTSIAHLAGALGRPAWTLLAHSADWRWMTGSAESVWYPSMKLFRQPSRGDWASVVSRVRRAVQMSLAPEESRFAA